jgi:restriction system protein
MVADITFHYPPELLNLLVETIPLLNRSKKDVLIFFRGSGIASQMMQDWEERLKTSPKDINKYEITRSILERLNARGEAMLRRRSEVLRRVVEFTNFDACWPADQLKAKGLVAGIRDVINQKDTFTRISQEREQERQARQQQVEQITRAKQEKRARIDAAKNDFYKLFGASLTPSERGKKLETALNSLFQSYEILVRESFHIVGELREGIVEQIDGVVELKGTLHFVEMKWYKSPVGKPEISEHLVRLISRAQARGIFISASDFTEPAVHVAREFLQHKLITFVHLEEIVRVLEYQDDLAEFLQKKIDAALIDKNPYFKPRVNGGARFE